MKTFKNDLIYYNNLNTGPFVIALTNFIDIYIHEGIDNFKVYVALPGVARKMLYESSDSKFSLVNKENADSYYTLKKYSWRSKHNILQEPREGCYKY